MNCLICNSNASSYSWLVKTVGNADYPIVRCDACKSAYAWPRPELRELHRLYSDQSTADSDFSASQKGQYRPTGEQDASRLFKSFGGFCKGLNFLDIGAGDGAAAAEATHRGLSVRAVDPSPVSRRNFAERLGFQPDAAFFDSDYALGPVSYVVNYAAYLFLRISELVNRSVVLNVCARRV